MPTKKGLIAPVTFPGSMFEFDEELVHPRSWMEYEKERDRFIAIELVRLRKMMDEARIECREKFNELMRMRGLLPIPDDAPKQKENEH